MQFPPLDSSTCRGTCGCVQNPEKVCDNGVGQCHKAETRPDFQEYRRGRTGQDSRKSDPERGESLKISVGADVRDICALENQRRADSVVKNINKKAEKFWRFRFCA